MSLHLSVSNNNSRGWRNYGKIALLVLLLATLLSACQPMIMAPTVAPDVDRVGFPEDLETNYSIFYEFDRPDNQSARVIYANPAALNVQPGEPFPFGSELVMAVYRTQKDEAGNVLLDEQDRYVRDELFGFFSMRKEAGFGAKYGDFRNGDWEYAAYRADGTVLTPPERTDACAICHMEAGQGKDWVFGTQRFFMPDHMLDVVENTVNVVDYSFAQAELTVPVGTEVTWSNHDGFIHTVTGSDSSFNSGALRQSRSFKHTFEEAGTYEYFCAIHRRMNGTIIVAASE